MTRQPSATIAVKTRTTATTVRHSLATAVAVLGIIIASTVGLHEWADAEAVRSLPAHAEAAPSETA